MVAFASRPSFLPLDWYHLDPAHLTVLRSTAGTDEEVLGHSL